MGRDTQGAAERRSRREAGFTPRFPSVVGGGADHQTPGERRAFVPRPVCAEQPLGSVAACCVACARAEVLREERRRRPTRSTAHQLIDRQWVGRHPRPVMHSSPLDVLVQQSSRRASASLLRYTYSMPTPTPLCGGPRSVPQDNHVSNIRRRLFSVRDTECNSAVLRCLCASSAGNTSETTFALRVRWVTREDDTQGAADERPDLLHGFPPLLVEVQITRPPARDASSVPRPGPGSVLTRPPSFRYLCSRIRKGSCTAACQREAPIESTGRKVKLVH